MKRPGGQGSLEDTCLPFSCPRTATPLPWVVPASLWGEILAAYWVCQHFPQWISDWLISFLCLIAEATGLCQASTFPHDTAGEKQGLVVNPVLVNAVVWMSVCGLGVYRLVDRRMSAWVWKVWGVVYVNGFNNCFLVHQGWSELCKDWSQGGSLIPRIISGNGSGLFRLFDLMQRMHLMFNDVLLV